MLLKISILIEAKVFFLLKKDREYKLVSLCVEIK